MSTADACLQLYGQLLVRANAAYAMVERVADVDCTVGRDTHSVRAIQLRTSGGSSVTRSTST